MQPKTVDRLLEINTRFYQEHASPFSATRQRLQPGVQRILTRVPPEASILDLGCGNGEFWSHLSQMNFRGAYTGLDLSPQLLDIARAKAQKASQPSTTIPVFQQADLSAETWAGALPPGRSTFDLVLAFAVLHHIPSAELRRKILQKVHPILNAGGQFIHSEWQFLNSSRLQERIQPWSAAGLSEADVEAGDYLLDWRREGRGLRYVHHFSPAELERLANECGFVIKKQFSSDGEGGKLGLYQVWEPT